jgi:TPR repeat protein
LFGLGDCCYEGNGTEKDLDQAAEWYRKALEAGYEPDETDRAHLKARGEELGVYTKV